MRSISSTDLRITTPPSVDSRPEASASCCAVPAWREISSTPTVISSTATATSDADWLCASEPSDTRRAEADSSVAERPTWLAPCWISRINAATSSAITLNCAATSDSSSRAENSTRVR